MVALAQLTQGWEAIVCDRPADFFAGYQRERSQVFVADDAFGRTEYDPSRGAEWERQLDRAFRLLDKRHWLLWTSRKHILERARREMDLQGKADAFPNPAAVLVSASYLSEQERALILYRHARSVHLELHSKQLVREYASRIVKDSSFTPERIRRFVSERLPRLIIEVESGSLSADKVSEEILEAIRNPTERMRRSFRALSAPHKWLLVALLECGSWVNTGEIRASYESYCPDESRREFGDLLEELSEAFVRERELFGVEKRLEWTHPSYRDLVIDELAGDPVLKRRFLENMSFQGVKLAISDTGGASGERQLPLMDTAEGWEFLNQRCVALVNSGADFEIAGILTALRSAAEEASGSAQDRVASAIRVTCDAARNKWNASGEVLSNYTLQAYFDASLLISPLPISPELEQSWKNAETQILDNLTECETDGNLVDSELLRDFADTLKIINENEPRFLRQRGFPKRYAVFLTRLTAEMKEELRASPIFDESSELRSEAERLETIAQTLTDLSGFVEEDSVGLLELSSKLTSAADDLKQNCRDAESSEPEYDETRETTPSESFDISALFSDL